MVGETSSQEQSGRIEFSLSETAQISDLLRTGTDSSADLAARLNRAWKGREPSVLRARQKLGKYSIEKRLASGGFASVYQAMDNIEGIRVALKIPDERLLNDEMMKDFKNEVRLTAKLDHPNILPLKYADFINELFVLVLPLGERTLAERLRCRMSFETAMSFAEQILEAVAYAHRQKIIHCDIKPENMILFADGRLRLSDFGIAKVAQRTIQGSGTGTVGYMAPEQAMGKPSARSDVFSIGLTMYRMLTGQWPEWPFEWPLAGYHRLKNRVHPELIELLRRSIEPNPRKRFRDADQMLQQYLRLKRRSFNYALARRQRRSSGQGDTTGTLARSA